MCVSDFKSPPESHCLISNISGNGNITIITNSGTNPVRLYIRGQISGNGTGRISSDGGPTDVALFGTDNTCGNTTSRGMQTFNANWQISGAASLSAFIYAPCAWRLQRWEPHTGSGGWLSLLWADGSLTRQWLEVSP